MLLIKGCLQFLFTVWVLHVRLEGVLLIRGKVICLIEGKSIGHWKKCCWKGDVAYQGFSHEGVYCNINDTCSVRGRSLFTTTGGYRFFRRFEQKCVTPPIGLLEMYNPSYWITEKSITPPIFQYKFKTKQDAVLENHLQFIYVQTNIHMYASQE